MPRHLIGDAHEWINEIPTVPTHSLAKLQPSQRSWDMYLCVFVSHELISYYWLIANTRTLQRLAYLRNKQTKIRDAVVSALAINTN